MGQIIELLVSKEIILPNKMLRAFIYACLCVSVCVCVPYKTSDFTKTGRVSQFHKPTGSMLPVVKRKKMRTLQLFSSTLSILSILIRFSYRPQCNFEVFRITNNLKYSDIFPWQGGAVPGLDPDQGPLFVWTMHVGFPPGAPDSSHSPNTCMFNEAMTLNCVCVCVPVCVLAQE